MKTSWKKAHDQAVLEGKAGYIDPDSGLFVLTEAVLRERGFCCENGCRHCPWPERGGDKPRLAE